MDEIARDEQLPHRHRCAQGGLGGAARTGRVVIPVAQGVPVAVASGAAGAAARIRPGLAMDEAAVDRRLQRMRRECEVSAAPALLLAAACAAFVGLPALSAIVR